MGIFRWLKNLGRPNAEEAPSATIEELEPRILYSGDLNPVAAPAPEAALQGEVRQIDESTVNAQHASLAVFSLQEERSREIVFVDARIPNAEQLVADITANARSERTIEIILIDASRDGIAQINEALADQKDVAAIHIVSHGRPGLLQLGNTTLDSSALEARATELQSWREALSADADLLIYGCDVAQGTAGQAFVEHLARLTGADVAASVDATGHESLGGDWQLEISQGSIETGVAVSAEAQHEWLGLLADTTIHSYEPTFGNMGDQAYEVKSSQPQIMKVRYDSPTATYTVDKIGLVLYGASDTSAQNITVSLRSTYNGAIIASGTIASSSLGTTEAWVTISLSSTATLNDNQNYFIRIESSTDGGKVYVGVHDSGTYTTGAKINPGDGTDDGSKDMAFRLIESTNAAPSATNLSAAQTYTEDTALNLTDIVISDVDSASVTATLTLSNTAAGSLSTATSGAVTSTYVAGTGVWTASGALANVNTLLAGVTFNPASNFNGNFTIATSVSVAAAVTGSKAMTGTAVNDAPAGTNATVTTNEDTAYTFSAATFGFTDVDAGDSLSAVRIDSVPGAGSLTLSGAAVSAGQVVTAAQLAAGNLVFTPAANANGAGYASFTFSVRDQSSVYDAAPNTLTVDVTAVNDAPAGTNATVTTNEDTAYTFASATFGFTDVDAGDSILAVRIDSVPVAGSLTLSGVAVNAGDVITTAQLAAGNLVFTPAANATGAGYASFTFSVRDQSNAFDAAPNTLTVNVTAVNDAPAGMPTITGTVSEDQILTATSAGIADVDGVGVFSYQWLRNGIAIGGATANTFTLGDADVGTQISVQVRYTDGQGTPEGPLTSAQTAAVANVNDAPTGAVALIGTATEAQSLSADTSTIGDADGLSAVSFQWQRSADGVTWINLSGATASIYLLTATDVGDQIRVIVGYTDAQGTAESLSSTALAAVVGPTTTVGPTVSSASSGDSGDALIGAPVPTDGNDPLAAAPGGANRRSPLATQSFERARRIDK